MEITFSEVRSKEVVNLYDGKRLGRIVDISFDKESGCVLGFIVPGVKKVFKKVEDIFIPLENVKRIGDDCLLVKLSPEVEEVKVKQRSEEEIKYNQVYARYKRTPRKI